MTTRFFIAILLFCWKGSLIASPVSDLSSPSQEVRDAAAKILRFSYTAPSRTNWDGIVGTITNGMTKARVLELLSPYHVTEEWGIRNGVSSSLSYRLDDAWILICHFRNKDDVLLERTLSPRLRYCWVAPPTNFTGIWITYFVNG